jgi:methylase of polypeptide subunit release factors
MEVLGVDISDAALKLARENLVHNVATGHLAATALHGVSFMKEDLLSDDILPGRQRLYDNTWDIVISNPPYISQSGFDKDTSRSVRNWEPKLALVPPDIQLDDPRWSRKEDIFYPRILDIAMSSNARIALMEVADTGQALRVARMALDAGFWKSVEIWRDWPAHNDPFAEPIQEAILGGHVIAFRGVGHGRAVFCRR